jgi:transcriptional regulator with XRE-family HTH domain
MNDDGKETVVVTSVRSTCTRDPMVAKGMRRIRLEQGLRLMDVAVLLECDVSRVSRIEHGERGTPDPGVVAGLLGVPVGYLLAPCPRCGYEPYAGYMCLRCGVSNVEADR